MANHIQNLDVQVYVFEEREQALRLYAENDQLKLRQLEDRKKVDLLLSLSGITEDEVTFFLSESSKRVSVVPQRLNRKTLKNKETKLDSNKENKNSVTEQNKFQPCLKQERFESDDPDILKLKVGYYS